MLKSGFAEQLVEADVLLFIEPEGVFITRSSNRDCCVCFRSVFIISVKKAFDLGERPASQSGHLSYAEKIFGIRRYSSLFSGENKNPRRKIFCENFEKPPLRPPRAGLFPVQYYNRAGAKTNPRCGLERSGADIGTEVFHPVVSCSMKGRFSYSVHYPDINRMK